MKKFFTVLLLLVTTGLAQATLVEIPQGGFSVKTPSPPKLTERDRYPQAPQNVIFPRITGKIYTLDSVIWETATSSDPLITILQQKSKSVPFSYSDVRDFTTDSGITGLRFRLQPDQPVKQIALHRFIFRNLKGDIICVGIYGAPADVEHILRSISLIKVEQGS